MEVRDIKNVELVVVTSDRGLCGSFNSNIIKLAQKKMREYQLKVEDAQYEMKQLEKKVLDPIFKEMQAKSILAFNTVLPSATLIS